VARSADSVGRTRSAEALEQFYPFGKGDAPLILRNTRFDDFAGMGVRDKNRLVIMATQRIAAMRHRRQFRV